MPQTEVMRIFFAIDLPSHVKTKIAERMQQLKKRVNKQAVRFTTIENLHITLQFLGAIKAEHLACLTHQVKLEMNEAQLDPLQLTLGDIILFPTVYRPRVIVIEVFPQEPLAQVAKIIGKGIQQMGYQVDERPFRAHLTIGRLKYSHGVNLSFLPENANIDEIVEVNNVVLFRSEPSQNCSKYTNLETIMLKAPG